MNPIRTFCATLRKPFDDIREHNASVAEEYRVNVALNVIVIPAAFICFIAGAAFICIAFAPEPPMPSVYSPAGRGGV